MNDGPIVGDPGDPGDERVEVVDLDGRVIEVVARREMRARTLRHRCTYVAVVVGPVPTPAAGRPPLTTDTLLVVHQRAGWKDTYPSYWDLAFGGVCGVGEAWLPSAERELAEEAGIAGATLSDLGPVSYEQPDNRVVGRAFVTAWPDPPVCDDGEVVAVDRVPLGELAGWVGSRSVCPDSAALIAPLLLAQL